MIDRRTLLVGSVGLAAIPALLRAQSACTFSGKFSGPVVAELLDDGRRLKLSQPISYIAKCGKHWDVPKGAISDGASIPGFLWWLVGTPLVGKYRNAAVVHDYYCAVRTEPFQDVHQMFYEAMLASNVSPWEAAKLYVGVKIGGPTWDELTIANARLLTATGSSSSAISNTKPEAVLAAAYSKFDRPLTGAENEAAVTLQKALDATEELKSTFASLNPLTPIVPSAASLDMKLAGARVQMARAQIINNAMLPKSLAASASASEAMAAPAAGPADMRPSPNGPQ